MNKKIEAFIEKRTEGEEWQKLMGLEFMYRNPIEFAKKDPDLTY